LNTANPSAEPEQPKAVFKPEETHGKGIQAFSSRPSTLDPGDDPYSAAPI